MQGVPGVDYLMYHFIVVAKQMVLCVISRVDGRHVGPVWQMEWVNRQPSQSSTPEDEDADPDMAPDHEETLVSVSGDGRVVQWAIRKEIHSNSQSTCLFAVCYLLFQFSDALVWSGRAYASQ